MFRRDKDSKLDNEGLRRMREAIRQRIEQEEGAGGEESTETPYRPVPPSNQAADGYTPPPSSYEPLKRESEYSFLGPGRTDRSSGQAMPVPATPVEETKGPTWEPTAESAPTEPVTTIAHDTAWRGTLHSSGPIRIEGAFEGEIITDQELFIAADAKVEANVRATSIIVAGQLSGQISCRERLEVRTSGRVSGQIDAGRFIVQEGAFLGGQVQMRAPSDSTDSDTRPALQRVR